jgi:replicative DNA helicase
MGKTGFGLGALTACCKAGGRALVFSLEMDELEVSMRLIARETGISAQTIEAKTLTGEQFQRFTDAAGVVSGWQFVCSDLSAEHLAALKGKARRAHAEAPLSLIVVDYLQLAEADGENRQQVVATIARGLKNLARELQVPIVALSQLSRNLEQRQSKVPQLSDLRESGEIEQAADVVLFIHREEIYDKETDKKGIAELHLAKNRNGPLGIVTCSFDGPTTTFRDLSRYQELEGY